MIKPLLFKNPPASLCILRLSAIGDVTHVIPIVRTLQQVWPDCRITWIIGKTEYALVNDLEPVEFIIFDKRNGLKAFRELHTRLANRRFDILLNMQTALRASLASLLIRSPLKLGFDRVRAVNGQWLFTNNRIRHQPQQHVLDSFFAFLEAMGVQQRVMAWDIPLPAAAIRFANQYVESQRKIVIINPCSSNRSRNWRNWQASRYAQVAEHAVNTLGAQVILTGGPGRVEHEMSASIREQAQCPITDLVGRTQLKQLLAVIAKAHVMIAPDTGPAHMATACGVPVIGLFASSNPLRTGPYLSASYWVNCYPAALAHFLQQSPEQVRWGTRVRHPEAMDMIQVSDVLEKLDSVLK